MGGEKNEDGEILVETQVFCAFQTHPTATAAFAASLAASSVAVVAALVQ